MTVQVVIPTRGNPRVETVASIENICRGKTPPHYVGGSMGAAETKSRIVQWFLLKTNASHLIILDDDVIPPTNFLSLAERGVEIVAGAVPLFGAHSARVPFDAVYRRNAAGTYIPVEAGLTGMHEVDAVGGASICIARHVLVDVRPAFTDVYDEDGRAVISEDFHFCQLAKAKGYKIWADFDVRCEHVKQMPLSDMAMRVRANP
jgi:hypothetical protein